MGLMNGDAEFDELDGIDFENDGFDPDELFDPAEFDDDDPSLQVWSDAELPPVVDSAKGSSVSRKGKALPMGVQVYEINDADLSDDDDLYD